MLTQTAPKTELFAHALKRILLGVFAVVGLAVVALATIIVPAAAATSSTINFQARLESNTGAIAADGNYNVEFKLYNASTSSGSSQGSCTGDANCLWVETRTGANQVRVANGYLTVNLGSVNAFGSTINWNQQLWLTMNIGGTGGTPSWDGEMSPRLQLTAVPYAFQAGALSATSGANVGKLSFGSITSTDTITLPDASGTVCLQSSSSCGFATGSGSAFLQGGNSFSAQAVLGTNDANSLAFRTNGTNRWVMDTSGNIQLQQASTFSVASATTGSQLTIQAGNATGAGNTGGNLLLQAGAGGSGATSGSVVVKANGSDSTAAFVVQNASGLNLLTADTSNQRLGIGTRIPANAFSVSPLAYSTGTVTRTNGSATLVGTGTTWTSSMVGDIIVFADGTTNTVSAFTDTTHVTMGTTYAGTTDASPVTYEFHIAGLQVTSSGQLGLGTTLPGAFFDLNGRSTQALLNLNGTSNPELLLQNNGSTKLEIGIATTPGNYIVNSAANDVTIRQTGGQKILFSTSATGATDDLVLSGGAVGVGTSTPQVALAVNGTVRTPTLQVVDLTNSPNYAASFTYDSSFLTLSNDFRIRLGGGTTPSGFGISDYDTAMRLWVARTGNVGIGNTNPQYLLDVTGTTRVQTSTNSSTAFQVQNNSGNQILTVDTSGSQILLGKAGPSGVTGTLVFQDSSNANTITIQSGATTASYSLTLPTTGPAVSQCLQTDSVTASQLVFGSCSGAAQTLQGAYNASAGASPSIDVTSANKAVTIQNDNTSPITGELFGVHAQTLSGLGASLFTVDNNGNTLVRSRSGNNSTTAFQIQNAAGDDNLLLANTTNPNLVANSSAETDAAGWFITTGTGTAPSSTTSQALYGNASLQANTSATLNAGVKYDTTTLLSAGTTYSLSFWAKIASGSFTVQAGRSDTDAFAGETACTLNASTVTTTWTRFTCSFTTGGTVTTGGYVFIRQSDSTARTWYLDGIQLEQASSSTAYHEGSLQFNGTITSPTVFQNGSDTTAAVQIQNAAGTSNLFVADTFDSRVGIGTASPGALLEVSETNNGAQELLRLSNPSNGTSATSEIHFRSGTINTDKATIIQGYDGTNFYLALGAGNPATEAMRVVGGKLGIGTTTVNTILQVSGSNGAPVNSGNLTTGGVIENGTTGAANNWGVDDTGSSSTSYAWLQGAYANNGGTHIYLSLNPNGGNVGIGTVSPGSTIQVNGNLAVGYSSSTAALASGISSNGDISIASNTDNAGLFIAKSGAYSNLEHNTGNGIEIDSANNTYGMYMGADPTNGLSYIQSVHIGVAATHLTLNPRGGFVAIGTQNFSSSLLTVGSSTSCALTGNFICGDYAEYYNSSEIAAAGDIMSVDASSSSGKLIKHASTAYDSSVVGIVSTTPAFVIEEGHMDIGGAAPTEPTLKPPIALAGRIPVKLSTINGPIHIGDAITSSDLVGFGMKATRAGTIVGKAMQEFDPANGVTGQGIIDCPAGTPTGVVCGEIFVFANTSWYDPDANLSGLGNFAITTGTQGGDSYQITDPSGSLVTRYGAYLGLDAANLQAGGIIAKNITTDTLMVNGLATFNGNLAVGGHIVTSGTTPAATAVLGAGTDTNGASNATCTVTGNDVSGVLTLATGDHSLADGAQCVVTFAKQFDIAPHPVITPLSKDSASVGAYLNATAQDMTILFSQAPLPSHTYSFNFLNIQ